MLKQIYKYTAAFLLFGIIASCSPDPVADTPLAESDVPILLNGGLRALGDSGDPGDGLLITEGYPLEDYEDANVNFYLTARTTTATPATYFQNQPIGIGGQNATEKGRNALTGNVYYPLGKQEINLYAHTGQIAANGNLTLTAGVTPENDILLGVGTDKDNTTPKSGTSEDPVEYITFKHLMTRVDVKIEVAGDVEPVKPVSMNMRFSHSAGQIVDRGTYNIFTGGNADENAINYPTTNDFAFTDITTTARPYYLVPNGANLTTYAGQIVSHLQINNYTATTEDLQALKFSQADKEGVKTDFILNPGLAYDLTFVINRLKIVDIQLTLKNWDPKGGNTEWGYEPKTMTLSTGSEYINNDITKMVLKYRHTDGKVYQYIGKGKLEGGTNKIDFVTLPADLSAGTLTADLYTKDGLLADDVEINPSGTDGFNVINLGKYGTKKNEDIYEISTPLQFALMVNDNNKEENIRYTLVNDLDMGDNSVEIKPTVFPTGSVLDGNGHDILNLNINGNGLFNVNYGTLKNFRIVSGLIQGGSDEQIGAICRINYGTIEAVVNQADIQPSSGQEYAGGIAGFNYGKITASVNSGNIMEGRFVGGIVGLNANQEKGAITACINSGMLPKDAELLGGIIGSSYSGTSGAIVNTCFWLSGTARKNQGVSNELAIGINPLNGVDEHSADLAASSIRNEAIDKLNMALTAAGSPWKFVMDPAKSSWPIVRPNP